MGLSLLFFGVAGPFKVYLGGCSAVVGIFEASLVYIFLRSRSHFGRIGALLGVGGVNIVVAWSIEALFRSVYPDRAMQQFWGLAVLLTGGLLMGTLSGNVGSWVWQAFHHVKGHIFIRR